MLRSVLCAAAAAGLLVSTAAKAESVLLFAPHPSGVDLTNGGAGGGNAASETYSVGGFSVTATGWSGSGGSNINLDEKIGGGDETGLGLFGQTDNEINVGQFVQFKFNSVPTGATTLSFQAGSTNTFGESNEKWSIYGSNTAGSYSTANLLATCTNSTGSNCETLITIANILGTWQYVDVVANVGNVLVRKIDAVSTVPLPGALPLFATGLGGLGLLSWRRKKKAAALAA